MDLIRVVVADDDDVMRHALTDLLHTDPRFEVVGHADTGPTLLEVVALTRPHVVLVDVRMPGGGVEAARAMASGPPVIVVAVTADASVATVLGMLQSGVRGYLVKGRIGTTLPDLVARCVDGEIVLATPTGGEVMRQLVLGRTR